MTPDAFLKHIQRNPNNTALLERLPELGLDDVWLVSGSLFQTLWNVLTDRPPEHGIKDYDVFYFDPDTSWDAEDRAIKRAEALFADLDAHVELRNQARVHLWYPDKFGAPYPPLHSSCEGVDRFLAVASMVAVQPAPTGPRLYAPGLDDAAAMRLRPNRTANFDAGAYTAKCARWQACWPELTVEPA